MSAQQEGAVSSGVSKGEVRGDVDKSWLDELPRFCDTGHVARIFGISNTQARRWMRGDRNGDGIILPSARRPDGRWVTAREHVVTLARKMYGEMGN